jgi:hydroxypyruvate reductase 1
VVTKPLPGNRWIEVLVAAGARVEVCALDGPESTILDTATIKELIGTKCDGAIGQLTEDWGGASFEFSLLCSTIHFWLTYSFNRADELFAALKAAGCQGFSNYAVGYNNVDVSAATKHGIPVGNTPGVLTETTAEIAAALTLAAARRIVEADAFMRGGHFLGWLPNLFVGQLLQGGTVGIVGAGRIGQAYARMMVEGHKMNVVYYDLNPQVRVSCEPRADRGLLARVKLPCGFVLWVALRSRSLSSSWRTTARFSRHAVRRR